MAFRVSKVEGSAERLEEAQDEQDQRCQGHNSDKGDPQDLQGDFVPSKILVPATQRRTMEEFYDRPAPRPEYAGDPEKSRFCAVSEAFRSEFRWLLRFFHELAEAERRCLPVANIQRSGGAIEKCIDGAGCQAGFACQSLGGGHACAHQFEKLPLPIRQVVKGGLLHELCSIDSVQNELRQSFVDGFNRLVAAVAFS